MPEDDVDDVISDIRSSGKKNASGPSGVPVIESTTEPTTEGFEESPRFVTDGSEYQAVRNIIFSSTEEHEIGGGRFLIIAGAMLLCTGLLLEWLDGSRRRAEANDVYQPPPEDNQEGVENG